MNYGSVCSGIGAPEQAWRDFGWQCQFHAEIEKFPAAVYAHHFQSPNLGDITKFKDWPDYAIDLLVGGTPCQSFSVAGLRKGLADPRGNLALTFLAILERYRPAWVVWENVPGVLSADDRRAFGAFLGGLAQLGYGFAYRVLDAQYFDLAQRRERVFVVGCAGGQWQRAAAVLFERESLCGNPPPSREKGQAVAGTFGARTTAGGGFGGDFETTGGVIAATLGTRNIDGRNERGDGSGNLVAAPLMSGSSHKAGHNARSGHSKDSTLVVADTLNSPKGGSRTNQVDSLNYIPECSPAIKSRDYKGPSSDGDGDGTPLVPTYFSARISRNSHTSNQVGIKEDGLSDALSTDGPGAIAFDTTQITSKGNYSHPKSGEPCHPLAESAHVPAIANGYAVRRLTPVECERLQGFPDNFTRIAWRGRAAEQCPDGPRYRALGNSMAVPVLRWIGHRIISLLTVPPSQSIA